MLIPAELIVRLLRSEFYFIGSLPICQAFFQKTLGFFSPAPPWGKLTRPSPFPIMGAKTPGRRFRPGGEARHDRPKPHRPLPGEQPHRGQEGRRGLPPQPVGDLLRLCQHHRRSPPPGGGGGPGQDPPHHRRARRAGVRRPILGHGAGPPPRSAPTF